MFSRLLTLVPTSQPQQRQARPHGKLQSGTRYSNEDTGEAETSWDGQERRSGDDRRKRDRRLAQKDHPLDTRLGQDRRTTGRRIEDRLPSEARFYRSIKIRA